MATSSDDLTHLKSLKLKADEAIRPRCHFCREPIQAEAKICPHCHTRQTPPSRWQTLFGVLKWVGAATAIFSLVNMSIQLSGFFWESRRTRISVNQLVKAADWLEANDDLSGALAMLDEALLLDSGDPQARDLQAAERLKGLRMRAVTGPERGHYLNVYIDKAIVHAMGHQKGSMGITIAENERTDANPGRNGVVINEVTAGGPAAQAGLRPGDQIFAVDDLRVYTDEIMMKYLAPLPPGESVTLTLLRQGHRELVDVRLGPDGEPLRVNLLNEDLVRRIVNHHLYQSLEMSINQ